MNYDMVALGDVCEFLDSKRVPVTESDRKPGPYPYYGANGQQGWIDGYIFDEPLVLLAEDGGSFGSKTKPIAYKVTGKTWVNNHAHVLRPKSDCDVDYLHRILSYYDVTKYVNGTTRQKLTKGNAEDIRIPLPPLPEQRRIADLLSRADRLRRLRRVGDALSTSLLQSVFLEMFGDALNGNNLEIPLVPLESLCPKITDGTHVTPNYIESGVPFVSIKDLTRTPGKIDFSDVRYISREEHEKISKLSNVERDDILYTKVGSYGIAQIVDTDREFSIFVSVALLKPDKTKVLPKFLETVMNSTFVKRQADNLVSGIGVPDLHLREIKTFQIPLPPLSEQEQFMAVVQRVESLRGRAGESARQGEGLFQSMLSEAFA